ncbi:helix-turn-helix domain-containing protein [Chryseobacterium sp. S-02]
MAITEIGVGISHYNKIENGQHEASVEMVDRIANFMEFLLTKL